jgi:DNA-binding response OmpR family regulator
MSSQVHSILLVDDDDGIRSPLASLLTDHHFKVLAAATEEEMRKHATATQIWIIDVRLPSKDYEGILAVAALAKDGVRSEYPVVFISVDPEKQAQDHLAGLRELGIDYIWLEKPFEFQLLLQRVDAIAIAL